MILGLSCLLSLRKSSTIPIYEKRAKTSTLTFWHVCVKKKTANHNIGMTKYQFLYLLFMS